MNLLLRWLGLGRIPCVRKRIIVNLVDGDTAIGGVLFAHDGAWLTLKDARYLPAKGNPQQIDGEVVIECAKVLFTQVVG